jgi:hypothetical protein
MVLLAETLAPSVFVPGAAEGLAFMEESTGVEAS